MASHPKNKIVLIPLTTKLNAKEIQKIMFEKPVSTVLPTKPKPKQKRKCKPSYPAEVSKGGTILNYFKPTASPAKTKTKPNLSGGQVQRSPSSSPLKRDPVAQSSVQS